MDTVYACEYIVSRTDRKDNLKKREFFIANASVLLNRGSCLRGAKRPPSATRDGVGTAALRLRRGDCAICGWRFGTMGEFVPCAARVVRPLRRAGISLAAASDQRPCDF